MKKRRDSIEVLYEIKCEIPGFSKDEFIDYTKIVVTNLYNELKNNCEIRTKCSKELEKKIKSNLKKYRITKDMDYITIQYADLCDCIKKEDELYIQVYLSVYFFDNVKNNAITNEERNKYWNDIWIITLKKHEVKENKKSFKGLNGGNCPNCGAVMKYKSFRNTFECEYCSTIEYNYSIKDWKIVDIEVES